MKKGKYQQDTLQERKSYWQIWQNPKNWKKTPNISKELNLAKYYADKEKSSKK
jgi:hypothetical protein